MKCLQEGKRDLIFVCSMTCKIAKRVLFFTRVFIEYLHQNEKRSFLMSKNLLIFAESTSVCWGIARKSRKVLNRTVRKIVWNIYYPSVDIFLIIEQLTGKTRAPAIMMLISTLTICFYLSLKESARPQLFISTSFYFTNQPEGRVLQIFSSKMKLS